MDEMATESLTGRLLVATPVLGDPNFRRTVILVVEHEAEEGTLGVVLNRPSEVPLGQVLEAWTELVTGPPVVFRGGPVPGDARASMVSVTEAGTLVLSRIKRETTAQLTDSLRALPPEQLAALAAALPALEHLSG